MKSQIDEKQHQESGSARPPKPPRGRLRAWLDERRIKKTVRVWHKRQKKAARRSKFSDLIHKLPHATLIGDVLYMVGFWVEYAAVCTVRTTMRAAAAILSHVGAILLMIVRPLAIGIITFL